MLAAFPTAGVSSPTAGASGRPLSLAGGSNPSPGCSGSLLAGLSSRRVLVDVDLGRVSGRFLTLGVFGAGIERETRRDCLGAPKDDPRYVVPEPAQPLTLSRPAPRVLLVRRP